MAGRAESLDDLMNRIKEAISLYLETEGSSSIGSFVGVQVAPVETS
jgi:predicted RNase H-like HicB family nuclease